MPTIPAGSVEYLSVPVTVTDGGEVVNPAVEVAIIARGVKPAAEDWQAAEWVEGGARVLLSNQLARGDYGVWVRVTDSPEVVVRSAGTLNLT